MAAGGGPIQVSPASITALREAGVLGEEAVAGVYGVGAGPLGDVEELVDGEVGVAGVLPPSANASSATRTCRASRSGSA